MEAIKYFNVHDLENQRETYRICIHDKKNINEFQVLMF